MIKNTIKKSILPVLIILALTNLVLAFGVGSPYWMGNTPNPMTIPAGETEIVNLNLQNMVGEEDINVEVKVTKGSEIASLETNRYFAKLGTADTMIPLKISVPEESAGMTYNVVVEVKTVTSGEGGMVALGTGMTIEFDVIVAEKIQEPKSNLTQIVLIIIIIVIALLAIILIKTKSKKSTNFKKK